MDEYKEIPRDNLKFMLLSGRTQKWSQGITWNLYKSLNGQIQKNPKGQPKIYKSLLKPQKGELENYVIP